MPAAPNETSPDAANGRELKIIVKRDREQPRRAWVCERYAQALLREKWAHGRCYTVQILRRSTTDR